MAARRTRTFERFTHVGNLMLRSVLVSKPAHVKPAEMRQALRRTLNALTKDLIRNDPLFIAHCLRVLRPRPGRTGPG